MWCRRRFCKKLLLLTVTFIISFYGSVLLFGDLKTPRIMHFADLHKCPVCYGISVCPELYSNQIALETIHWSNFFNAKNIYYGYTKSNRRVILKKLAHDWELKDLDDKLCKLWGFKMDCNPKQLLNVSKIDERIIKVVEYNVTYPDTEVRKGLVMCPYAYSIFDYLRPVLSNKKSDYNSDMINIWTMLKINPEPIIIQTIPKSLGWPVPAYGGVCGRLELVAYEGEPLSSLLHIPWYRRLKFAKKIIAAAMDFTFKHDRYRFYLMDWSLDNIVANEKDDITFVDLEDVIILDKHILPRGDLPDWYSRYTRDLTGPGFTFSIENICKYHLSDHNIWAACYLLVGDETPLLYPIPEEVSSIQPYLNSLLKQCLNSNDRFSVISKLQHLIEDMLSSAVVGAVR